MRFFTTCCSRRRLGLFVAVGLGALGLLPGAAFANSSLSVNPPSSIPVNTGFTLAVSGDAGEGCADNGCNVDVYLLDPGEACAQTSSDTSDLQDADKIVAGYQPAAGNFTLNVPVTNVTGTGLYTLCGYLYEGYSDSIPDAYNSASIQVGPTDVTGSELAITAPASVEAGQGVKVTVSGYYDTLDCGDGDGCTIDVYALPPGQACAQTSNATSDVENADEIVSGYNPTIGPFSRSFAVPGAKTTGSYTLCAYMYQGYSDSIPTKFEQADISVVPRPQTCVVPSYTGLVLVQIERQLKRAHCAVGRISYRHSTTVRRGAVIRLSVRTESKHAVGFRVNIVASRGARGHR
jgi:hypothetical protein